MNNLVIPDFRSLEREYDPAVGNLGRGFPVSQETFESMSLYGYEPYRVPGTGDTVVTILSASLAPNYPQWRGFVREEDGKHYVVAFETFG